MKRTALLLGFTILAAGAAVAQGAKTPIFPPNGFDTTAVDPSTRPGDDFFQYANGRYLARVQIPADRPAVTRRLEMTDRTDQQLKALLEEAANGVGEQPADVKGKVGAFMPRSWTRRRSSAWVLARSSPSSIPSAVRLTLRASPA